MLARDWMIVLIIFGMITGIGSLVVYDISSSEYGYDVPNMTDGDYNNSYDTLTDATIKIGEMANATSSKEGQSTISPYTLFFKATFSVIGIIFNSFGIASSTLATFGEDIGMPSSLANLLFSGIMVLIVGIIIFVVVSAISRGRL